MERSSWLLVACFFLLHLARIQAGERSGGQFSLRRLPFNNHRNSLGLSSDGGNRSQHNKRLRDHCSIDYSFDYVQLTLMWPPGSCSTSPQPCDKEENKHFTVHGMWPTIRGTQKPAFCCFDNTFDYNSLKPLAEDLNEYWYSYFGDSSRRFWSHEWLKHGTCSREVRGLRGEVNYFGTTLKLAKQLPILDSLKKFNIIPDDNKKYPSSDILKALEPIAQGKVVQIDCDLEHHQPIPVLTGVAFCFDANLGPTDCPPSKTRCRRELIFRQTSTRFA